MLLKKFIFYLCFIISVFAIPITSSFASTQTLKVGVLLQMPFAQNINGRYSGIAVDIWENIAKANNWTYTYIPLTDITDTELAYITTTSDIDIIIGPIPVNNKRLQTADFSRPFFLSSVNIITKKYDLNIKEILEIFISNGLFLYITVLLVSFMLFITILWYIEKGRLNDVFTHYYNALTKGIWFHLFRKGASVPKAFYARLMLTPTTIYSRIITIFWLILAAIIFTTINASYIASITLNLDQTQNGISSLKDLAASRVAGVAGHVNVDVAETNGIYVQKVKTFSEAIQLLEKAKIDAVVCDAPVGIEYLRSHKSEHLVLNPLVIQNDELAFPMHLNSPIKHAVDIGITHLQDTGNIIKICKKYIGAQATRCDM